MTAVHGQSIRSDYSEPRREKIWQSANSVSTTTDVIRPTIQQLCVGLPNNPCTVSCWAYNVIYYRTVVVIGCCELLFIRAGVECPDAAY